VTDPTDEPEPQTKAPVTDPRSQGEFDHNATFQMLAQARTRLARARIDYRLARAGCGPREGGPGQKARSVHPKQLAKDVAHVEAQVSELIKLEAESKDSATGLKGPQDLGPDEGGEQE
jgi:hypothetical protein